MHMKKSEIADQQTFRQPETDPQGSYTGVPEEPGEVPVQDVDDL